MSIPNQSILRCCAICLLGAVVGIAGATPLSAGRLPPDEWLKAERNLHQRGRRWLLPLEIELQQRVRRLPELEQNLLKTQAAAQQILQARLAANGQVRIQTAKAQAHIQSLLRLREGLGDEGQKKMDVEVKKDTARLQKLKALWVPPDRLAGQPEIRAQLVNLTNRRNDLAVNILWIHDKRPALKQQYEELAGDQQVAAALAALGPGHALGSGKDYDTQAFLQMLAGFERHVFTDELPLYRVGDELRVTALINRTPVTFTWREGSEPAMLTSSVIEAAGLVIPADAPLMEHITPDKRKLQVRQINIPYLRLGRHVLKDVPALALPPEGENLGTQLGPAALGEHSPRAQPEKFRLVIR